MTPEQKVKIKKIYDELKTVRKAKGGTVKVKKNTSEAREHIKEFYLKKKSSFSVDNPAVIAEAKKLAADSTNTLFVVATDSEYELYTMKPEHEIRAEKSKSQAEKSSCFIATAAYGSPLAPEVILLSHFRDEILLRSKLGVPLVSFYYRISPPLALLIGKIDFLRAATRTVFLAPILRLIKIWKFRK